MKIERTGNQVMDFIDPTTKPREGEELEHSVVAKYLKETLGLGGKLFIEQFPSGHSNLTYLLRVDGKELVLRKPPFGAKKIKSGHDMRREYIILSKLYNVYPQVPKPIVFCEDESILGSQFYIMERIKGVILRKDPPEGMKLSPEIMRKLCESFVDNMVSIHSLDYKAIGLGDLGRPEGFLERQVNGWIERYERAKTDEIPEVSFIIKWLKENVPESGPASLIHNDYKFDNLVLSANDLTKIIGVLDWEMSTIGDPLIDLGVALGYWVQKDDPEDLKMTRTVPTNLEGAYTRRELAERYQEKTQRDLKHINFYYALSLFKIGVIAQQIYYRYAMGFTGDKRFELMITGVKILMRHSALAIEKGKL